MAKVADYGLTAFRRLDGTSDLLFTSNCVCADIPGLARAARHDVIAEHGYVLTLGRYVGAEDVEEDGPPPPHGLPRCKRHWRNGSPKARR